ncbi:alpha-glucosidase precursor [Ampelomyces quisqualis]|uniref:alpha-glucosidase n=1 Tax=Ampelomyces quisqualis TaxID=50730 RepID=A0A6A5Q6B3_AMPQU|nr:alpha-glucosidase precursor [Ampelomyces quisqualis]
MFSQLLLALALSAGLNAAVPFSQEHAFDAALQTRETDPNTCPGYAASNVVKTDSGLTADLSLAGDACNIYSDDIKDLKLVVEYQTNERLHVKIYDSALQVYQVQEEVFPRPQDKKATASDSALEFNVVEKPFSFTVKRKENGEILFDTSAVPFIFENQYVRLRTNLPQDPNIYGLGEHSDSFRFEKKYQRVLWNSESPEIPRKANLYGSHPVYFDHRGGNGTHGVFMLNSSPMQIDLNQDSKSGTQYLEYNAVGGIIDLYFLAGKLPTDVSKQYAEVAGLSAMYPYWSLGFHQCKFGYWDVNMVAEVVANYSAAGIPLEVMWTDIDYMDLRQDFTTDPDRFPIKKVRELVSTLHERDQRYVLILDPAIHAVGNMPSYQRGLEQDVFLKAADGSSLLGVQWPGAAVWPDWFHPNTQKWWTGEISSMFSKDTGIDLDGIWVDMNEGSNFCEDQNCKPREKEINEKLPPRPQQAPRPNTGRPIPGFPDSFQPGSTKSRLAKARGLESRKVQVHDVESVESRSTKFDPTPKGLPDRDFFNPNFRINNHRGNLTDFTIYTNTTNHDGSWQYDTHNLYGHMMSHTTQASMLSRRPGLRPFVLTRSTWAGTGRKATHWFGDNASTWDHYRTSIRQMLSFVSMHQMPMVGSDVCGFNRNAEEVMCARWALLGAFQPFYRNHAEISTIFQEFYQWPLVTEAAKKAISTRYKLLDYIYTALHKQTVDGTPMINPLFFMYPNDPETFGIQEQWFYGPNLLISPVVEENSQKVNYYVPEDTWYDFWTHKKLEQSRGWATEGNVTATDIPIHIRGGSIIPMRANSANTTKALRQQDFVLLVAPDKDGKAHGTLYLDEGEKIEQPNVSNIEFTFADGKLRTTGSFNYKAAKGESIKVASVIILGQNQAGKKGNFDADKKTVEVKGSWQFDQAWDVEI